VYIMVEFFNTRVPGRPIVKEKNIKPLAQKVQMKIKDSNVRTK